ncbi:MAG: extracellular solute-binding protein [Candidatus Tectomicrobia bacterium]|nr:extracellular solute-binding protein [Candidatus Tectomicrobia bacterium]
MSQQPFQLSRRQFIASAALATGGVAMGAAPVFAQKPKLVYWAYQFLRSSDESRVAFAEEWAKQNNVDLQITLVPWKEFMAKISAAIQAKATPDIVENGGVQLRSQGQLLEVTDVYEQLEKEHGGWLGAANLYMKEADGRVHHILYGLTGSMVIARNDIVSKAGATLPAETWADLFEVAKKTNRPPRVYGLGQPVSNQTDSNIWEQIMRSYGARLADDEGKKIVLGDHKSDVWTFLDFFQEVWDSGVLPPGVTTWDNTMNNSTYQAGKSVIALNPITITLWLENNDSDLLPKTGHFPFPTGPKRNVWDVGYASRSILKYTKHPEVCKQFLADSMAVPKMEKELSVSQWAPVLKSYLPFDLWDSSDHKKALVNVATKGNPQAAPDVYNDAWVEQATNTTISRMLQRMVVDKWNRDKAFDEAVDVLGKIYSKYTS